MPDSETQMDFPVGPDLKHPDWVFRDGKGLACVRILPVDMATWGAKTPRFSVEDALVLIVAASIRRWWRRSVRHDVDDRWKVISARSKQRFPYVSRVYALQFASDEAEAEALQAAALSEWVAEQYRGAQPLGPRERERLRRR